MVQSLSLVLPVWNEEDIISGVVHDIEKVLEENRVDYELLLIENGSVDHSLDVIQELSRKNPRCRVIVRPKGYGSAVIGGLKEATKELVGYMPSDGQIEPGILIELLKAWDPTRYDLVKINRVERESLSRKFISFWFNSITRLIFGLSLKDINGSPKLFPTRFVSRLSLKSLGNLIDTEFMAKARRLKWRILEIPTESKERAGGKSHVNLFTVLQFISELIRLRFSQEIRNFPNS